MSDVWNRIEIVVGDITAQHVDVVVNAANSSLLGGGGVDGAIHRVAGPELLAECRTFGGCPTGEARITLGYRLPARHVIHTVGPIWSDARDDDPALAACYRNALALARENGLRSIAFPSISTGAYRFPLERATRIALHTVAAVLAEAPDIGRVVFVCFDEEAAAVYRHLYDTARSGAVQ